MVNPLDRNETPRRTGFSAIEDISVSTGVPANVLIAIGETAGARDEREMEEIARRAAEDLSPRIQGGQRIEDIITELAGEQAPAFMQRARQIGEERYPEQMRAAREAVQQAQEQRRAEEPGLIGDASRQLGAGFISGVGAAVEGVGLAADQVAALGRNDEHYRPGLLARAGETGGDWFRNVSEGLRAGVSEETRQAIADSTPSGDITDLSSISFGENPSLRGYSMLTFDVLGSFLPVVLAALTPGGAVASAGVGAAQGAGAGAEVGRSIIEEAYQQRGEDGRTLLEGGSPLFRELLAQGMDEEQAFEVVRDSASRLSALFSGSVAGLGGAATGAIVRGGTQRITRAAAGPLERAMVAGVTSAVEEGTQEALESMASRFGVERASGMDLDLTEGTFGDFILGALGGGPVGAVAGAMQPGRVDEEDPGAQVDETGQGGVVSPPPAAPGGQVASPAQGQAPREQTAGRDEYRGTPITVRLAEESAAWDATIVGETADGLTVQGADGQTYEIPRADIEAGDVEITPVEVSTAPEPLTPYPAPRDIVPLEPELADASRQTRTDALRILSAIEARAQRTGWTDEMRDTAEQLRAAIDGAQDLDPLIESAGRSDAATITRRDGTPFGDEDSARRGLGSLGESADGYEIVPVDGGGYVARPRLTALQDARGEEGAGDVLDGPQAGPANDAGLRDDDAGRGGRPGQSLRLGSRDRTGDPADAPAGAVDNASLPDAAGTSEPEPALNEQQNVQPAPTDSRRGQEVTRRDGTPFGDLETLERAIQNRDQRVDDFDIIPVEGGYVARPKAPTENAQAIPGIPVQSPLEGQQAPEDTPRQEAPVTPPALGGNAQYQGRQVQVTRDGPWDFQSSFPEPDQERLTARLNEGRDDMIDSPDAVVSMLDETMRDLTERVASAISWADDVQRIERGEAPRNRIPKKEDQLAFARRQAEAAARDADDQASAMTDVWPLEAVDAAQSEALRRARGMLADAGQPQGGGNPPTPTQEAPQPTEINYPNRRFKFQRARADAPVNGLGDSSEMSLGNIALASVAEGDEIPGRGRVRKVTDKQIQIERPDGKVERISADTEKFNKLARDVGEVIQTSALTGADRLGSTIDMIERDPALYYVDGVPQLFDGTLPANATKQRPARDQFGRAIPQQRPAQPPEPTQPPAGPQQTPRQRPSSARPSKVPLAQAIRRLGGIAPTRRDPKTGENVPTWMASELRNRGITPRTHPYLFNHAGQGDFDNIDPATLGPDAAAMIGTDETGRYIDRDALLDRLEAEVTGQGATNLDANAGPTRQDVEREQAERERAEMIEGEVDAEIQRFGVRLVEGERDAILSLVYQGEAIDDAIDTVIERTAIQAEGVDDGRGQEGALADGAQPAEMGDVPFGDEPLTGQGPADAGTEAGSPQAAGQPSTAGGRREARRDDDAVPADQRDVTPEAPPAVTPVAIEINGKRYPVQSYEEASEKFVAARDAGGFSVRETPSPIILDANGNTIAHVSYNGRVWEGAPGEWGAPGQKSIYRPKQEREAVPATERTEAGEQTVIPGAEQSQDQARRAQRDRDRAEIEARQRQSKMRRLGGNEGAAGPLFDDGPADLFAAAETVAAAAQETDPEPTPAQAEAERLIAEMRGADATQQGVGGNSQPPSAGKIDDFGEKWDGMTSSRREALLAEIGGAKRADGKATANNRRLARANWDQIASEAKMIIASRAAPILAKRDADLQASRKRKEEALNSVGDDVLDAMHRRHKEILGQEIRGNEDRGSRFSDMIAVGAVTGGYGPAFDPSINKASRQVFEEFSGQKLPRSQKATREFLRVGAPFALQIPGGNGQADMKPADPSRAKQEAKIDDFGEKIGGARKDVWSGYADRMAEAENFDIGDVPLAKSWPEPNYQALIDGGVDPWSVAFVRAARDSIPRKPTGWKRKHWVESVRVMRDFATKLMSGEYERGEIEARMDGNRSLEKVAGTVALYETFGHSKSLKGLTFSRNKYSVLGGVSYPDGKFRWEVTKEAKATAFSNMPRIIAAGDTQQEAIDAFRPVYEAMSEDGATPGEKKADKRSKFIIWSQRGETPKVYRVGVKIRGNWIALREGITDVAEARRIIAEEGDALQAQLDKMKDIPSERRDENAPRVGADHRGGVDVTPEMFQEAFGFRGVEFGNYVEGPRRQEELNNAYDALLDLAGILDVPSQALSLNGNLALAFGARGSGGKNAPKAHFEPGKVVINLTKRAGRGSLAHEWFHALDNYFAKAREPMRGTYITDNNTPGGPQVVGIRPEVVDAFRAARSAIAKTDLHKRSGNLDRLRTNAYWGTGIELHARAFESYVIAKLEDQGASNDYLANVVDGAFWSMLAEASGLGDSYPYLKADEIETVRPAFDALFNTIETKQTEAGVAMYSRRRTPLYSGTLRAAEALPMKKGTGPQFLASLSKQPGVKAEELDWTGVRDFLRGKDKVTRDELVEHIRANQVQVVEHRKGGEATNWDEVVPSPTVAAKYNAEWKRLNREIDAAREEMRETRWERDPEARDRYNRALGLAESLDAERDKLHEQMVAETIEEMGGLPAETQFQDWRTPGGRQYRELLLAMPERDKIIRTPSRAPQGWNVAGDEVPGNTAFIESGNTGADYRSSHWSEPNVLAHIRFDERDAEISLTQEQKAQNARRAELQAEYERLRGELAEAVRQTQREGDNFISKRRKEIMAKVESGEITGWGEAKRLLDNVFVESMDRPETPGMARQREIQRQIDALDMPEEVKPGTQRTLFIQEIQSDWHQAGRKKGYRDPRGRYEIFNTQTEQTVQWVETEEEAKRIALETMDEDGKLYLDYLTPEMQDNKSRVPDAPLKKTWHETAFRRAVAWAVEQGFDSVTWATGDMNAELFTLDSHIAAIEWTWHPGTQEVEVQAESADLHADDLSMWRDRETLDDAVGRELADRINREIDAGKTTDTYRGLDLKVGGEGMRGFYDKIVPNYAAKWGKRFGAKVGKIAVPVNESSARVRQIVEDVWHMPITDQMRATVQMEGVALFKRGEAPASVVSAKAEAVKADLKAAWNRMSIPDDARLRVVDQVFGMDPDGETVPVDGLYVRGLVQVALDSQEGVFATLHHEAIHALRDPVLWGQPYGLFSEGEWSALEAEARRSWMGKYDITGVYPDLTPGQQLEEAIAAAFADHMTRGIEPDAPPLRRAIRRAMQFFRALGRALRGAGVQDTDAIFGRVASGAVGQRGQGQPATGAGRMAAAFSRAPAERNADGTFASNAVKYSRRLLAEDGPVTDKAERGIIGQILTDAMGGKSSRVNLLALVPGEPLYQELAKDIPSARTYLREKHAMSAMRNKMQAEAAETMDDWRGFMMRNRKHNDALMDLMHDATRAGQDPARPFTVRAKHSNEAHNEYDAFVASRRIEYQDLKARWDALPKKAQEVYRKVRDTYVATSKLERQIIEDNVKQAMEINLKRARLAYEDRLTEIEEEGLEGDERMDAEEKAAAAYTAVRKRDGYGRAARLRSLRLMLESNEVDAPYFPLLRHGQYAVAVKDADGKLVSFSKAESERQQSRIVAEARKEFGSDHTIDTFVLGTQEAMREVDPLFVADIENLIGDSLNDPQLMDSIWQRYLESLPDFSMRKSRLHRKGTPGFSRDAFRNFARQMFHSAHQLARLKHGMPMQMALDDAQREARKADDPNRAGVIVNEMAMRHDWIMNPSQASWSTWATSAAFVYYLGMTPAAALVNLSQTAIVGIPVLAAAYKKGGVVRASRQLMRALREFGTGRGAVERAKSLSPDERAAIKEAYERGIIDKSQAHDQAGVAESGVEYSDIRQRIMVPIAFMFHHAERLNREITFLAAYRMARDNGLEHESAIDDAGRLTWKTHFNYESDSRPRLQQDDWVRVATVFRNFQLNMLFRLFRDTHQAFKGRTAEDRAEARTQLIGITGMMMLSAGVTGTWGYALTTTLAGMLMPGAGTDDIEKEVKNALVNLLGRDVAGLILNGVPGHLTGINLSSRIGMPELWFRSPGRQLEGDDLYTYWAQQFLGAVPGMAQNIFRGVDIAAGGDIWRGMETASPKFIRDIMRGLRYSQDGVTTMSGNSILESVSPGDALVQAMGFTPAQISERYEVNRWMMNENSEIQRARSGVLNDIWRDVRDGGEISASTLRRLDRFNEANPDYQIDRDTIRSSIRARHRGAADTVGGVRLNNRTEARIRADAPVSIYEAAQ